MKISCFIFLFVFFFFQNQCETAFASDFHNVTFLNGADIQRLQNAGQVLVLSIGVICIMKSGAYSMRLIRG